MKIIDLSYHSSYSDLSPEGYLKKAQSNINYAQFLKQEHQMIFVFHSGSDKEFSRDGVSYIFRKKRFNSKWLLPLSLTLSLARMKPDILLVHSIIYIHFAALLRLFLSKKTAIFIQNHAEKPPNSALKRTVVKYCDRAINGYLFSSRELARPWIDRGLLASMEKVHEVMEGSSSFRKLEKQFCRAELGIPDVDTFIWVGRLDTNKDPLCVLKAFQTYSQRGYEFKLYMFYRAEELLGKVENFITGNGLDRFIELRGNIAHPKLEQWYNASDFFVAASHFEGSGYALSEAMSCGCIPLLSDIPSFRYMTNNGKVGAFFSPGNSDELLVRLEETQAMDKKKIASKVLEVFQNRLSFPAIAKSMEEIYELEK